CARLGRPYWYFDVW
nr:immunoglobulin heavy chain junction region [Mus musculus]MBK4184203.1 immunoglobulin heavy chain junction region [Mus musculus]MBK4184204.1 immunoglobulin heavy chain junction region [Mus musculus]